MKLLIQKFAAVLCIAFLFLLLPQTMTVSDAANEEKKIVGVEVIEIIEEDTEEVPLANIRLAPAEALGTTDYTVYYLVGGIFSVLVGYFVIDNTRRGIRRFRLSRELKDLRSEK